MRRHHLIEESKAELDIAYEGVKAAENEIMALEFEYNERINELKCEDTIKTMMAEKEKLQEAMQIEVLYEVQTASVQRFANVSSAFTIVSSVDNDAMAVDLLRNLLFCQPEAKAHKIEIDSALRDFSRGLQAYTREDSSEVNDRKVRQSWALIEQILAKLR